MNPEDLSVNVSRLARRWWVLVVRGIAAILFGLFAFLMPGLGLGAMVFLWGSYAIVEGVFSLVLAARGGGAGESWGWLVLQGLVSIIAGVVTFVWPGITALALLVVVAIWAVLTGISGVAVAVSLRRQIRGEWMLVASGVLSILFGMALLVFPGAGLLTLTWVVGAYALGFGALLIGLGVRLNRWGRDTDRSLPAGRAPTHA